MSIIGIRKRINREIFDYQTLMVALEEYAHPRDKITDLIRKNHIIRIKKGLYIFGDDYRRYPFSRELLANLIYGPSYISLEYALHYHGLTPERVEALTSITTGRSRSFLTPVGLFKYYMIPLQAFQTGMMRVEQRNGQSFLIAEPDKALADKIVSDRGIEIKTQKTMYRYLVHDLRIDSGILSGMNPERLAEFAMRYRSQKLRKLSSLVLNLRRNKQEKQHA
ncbi:hypothetical protein ES703_44976 [subsurface metagenome]